MSYTNPFIHIDDYMYTPTNIQRGTLTEVHISDIHFGVMDPKVQFDILMEQFYNKIININFDILSIDGDLFDHKFLSNSDAIMYATLFINNLVNLCKSKNATLVLLHGTESHDAKQLKLFYHYIKDPEIDIRIVESIGFEYIKGARCLCIPEEYGKGREYYEKFLYHSGIYDTVFMHGTIKGAIFGADKEDLDSVKAPVFDINSFGLCTGPIIAGHVHVAGCYNGYMYYNGSPYRWCFGEEQPKGFMIVLHNLDTQAHYAHFEPIESFRYDTINLDSMVDQDPKLVIQHIKQLQAQGIDNIRIEFTLGGDDFLEIIKSYYKNNPNVKIKADTASVKQQIKQNDELQERYKEYNYILDPNLTEYDILARYINQNKGYTFITAEELIALLKEI